MSYQAIKSIYKFEINRAFRTVGQSIISPVISTTLYFVVFGAAMGCDSEYMAGVPYGAFIVPGPMMMTVLTLVTTTDLPSFLLLISFLLLPTQLVTSQSKVKKWKSQITK